MALAARALAARALLEVDSRSRVRDAHNSAHTSSHVDWYHPRYHSRVVWRSFIVMGTFRFTDSGRAAAHRRTIPPLAAGAAQFVGCTLRYLSPFDKGAALMSHTIERGLRWDPNIHGCRAATQADERRDARRAASKRQGSCLD